MICQDNSNEEIDKVGIYPKHPFFSENRKNLNKKNNESPLKVSVDDCLQMSQFWRYNNTVSSNSFASDSISSESSENHQSFIEYFTSLLDAFEKKNGLSSFFPKELLMDTITVRKRNKNSVKKTYGIRKAEHQKKQTNEEEIILLENNGTKDDIDLFSDDESEIDFEYINPGIDDDYDELEDNIKDQDVI